MMTSSGSASGGWRAWPVERSDLRASCVRFGRLLREHGLPVAADRVLRWLSALDLLGCKHPADLYWSGRVTLVSGRSELERYDQLFRQFWLQLEHAALRAHAEKAGAPASQRWQVGKEYRPPGSGSAEAAEPVPAQYSDREVLHQKDFSAFDREDEKRLIQWLRERPQWLERPLRSRRTRQDPTGDRIDIRRTVRAAVRGAGEMAELCYRKPVRRRRKWVFLCDVSASMTPYARALLLFASAVAASRGSTEVLLFGTRLTRVTAQLQRRGAASATVLLESVRDYGGGTRLGEALEQFLRQYGRRGMAHGADLFILSDGIDHGEEGRVGAAMAVLDRMVHSVNWVNPLSATRGYAPETRAMREALPFLDRFVSGHNLQTLLGLLIQVAQGRCRPSERC